MGDMDNVEVFLNWRSDQNDRWTGLSLLHIRPASLILKVGQKKVISAAWVLGIKFWLPVCVLWTLLHYALNSTPFYRSVGLPKLLLAIAIHSSIIGFVWPFLAVLLYMYALPFVWAWNRRADRLSREASLPQPVVSVAPGVWPPPPTVPETHTKV
jgi:hypothetical protein